MKKYYTTLTIAGSDCSGGAGIQADLKTFAALGCYGLSVITALTAQNTQGIQDIYPVPSTFVKAQLNSVFQDIAIDALKLGMLHNAEIIDSITERLLHYKIKNIVLDPVMLAKDGSVLLQQNAFEVLQNKLFPLVTLLTPNIAEAELISQFPIRDRNDMEQAAKKISMQGPDAVLIKGGHLATTQESYDCLYDKLTQKLHWFTAPRISTPNTHGTGCTLSAAITAYLAQKKDLFIAVEHAKKYITEALIHGQEYSLGKGHGPVDHFF